MIDVSFRRIVITVEYILLFNLHAVKRSLRDLIPCEYCYKFMPAHC